VRGREREGGKEGGRGVGWGGVGVGWGGRERECRERLRGNHSSGAL